MPRRSAYRLRISLLEQCQLRCGYCRPRAFSRRAAAQRASKEWLRADDHATLARAFERRGVAKVRFTGGEPLLRDDVAAIVAAWRRWLPGVDIAMTTNGLLLSRRLPSLVETGLDRLNVHLDTLRADRYRALMGAGAPDVVLGGCAEARAAGVALKLNVVVQRGLNDDELLDFLALSARHGLEVRFIELMDTGSAREHVRRTFLSGEDIVARIHAARSVTPAGRRHDSDPAVLYRCDDDGTVFGVIASDTKPFCERCDRLRLSAGGILRGCLYAPGGVPLGERLRGGASDDELLALIDAGLDDKRSWHPLVAIARPAFSMAEVGG